MAAGTIVLLRHGRTAWNVEARLQGQTDVPLDAVGRAQVDRAACALARVHAASRIVSSDLARAQDTARACGDLLVVGVQADPRLRERHFGAWEGLTEADIRAGWPAEFEVWRCGDDENSRPPGGESRAEVATRLSAAIGEHAAMLGESDTLLLISHGAAIGLALGGLLGLDPSWRGFVGLDNAHWSVVVRSRAGMTPMWRVAAHNVGAPDEESSG